MTEEERQQAENGEEQAPEEAFAEDAPAEEAALEEEAGPEEEAPAAEPAEEEAPAEEAPAAEAEEAPEPAEEAPAAEPEEAPGEELSPKQRRKRERSRTSGPVRPQRSLEERAAERAERRRAAGERRRRYRQGRRARRGERGTGTPPSERTKPAAAKVRQGTVVSSRAEKTISVRIEIVRRHPMYEKVVRRTRTVHAHDERNEASDGDIVRLIESRPLSRRKRWRLLEIVERAPARTPVPAAGEEAPAPQEEGEAA